MTALALVLACGLVLVAVLQSLALMPEEPAGTGFEGEVSGDGVAQDPDPPDSDARRRRRAGFQL